MESLFGKGPFEAVKPGEAAEGKAGWQGRSQTIRQEKMAMDRPEHWRLCKVRIVLGPLAEDEPDEWNGIVHLPTWTCFRIEGEKAKIVALGGTAGFP